MYLRDKNGILKAKFNESITNYVFSNNPTGDWGVSNIKNQKTNVVEQFSKFTFSEDCKFVLRVNTGGGE